MREMRRKNQALTREENLAILKKNTAGVLSVLGVDEYPYGVPLSYTYIDNKIIFHGAKSGHKIDAIKKHNKASFCVIDQDIVIPERNSTNYKSVIAFGKIHLAEDENEKAMLLRELTYKYSPMYKENNEKEISAEMPYVSVMVLEIEHLSGKEAKKL